MIEEVAVPQQLGDAGASLGRFARPVGGIEGWGLSSVDDPHGHRVRRCEGKQHVRQRGISLVVDDQV